MSSRDSKGRDEPKQKAVVSIDVGTSRSGFAISLANVDHIYSNSTSASNGTKIPTILLLRASNLEFVAFGPEAKQIFDEATIQKREEFLYFANFKMSLYSSVMDTTSEKDATKETEEAKMIKIKPKNNHRTAVDAHIVFQHCIRYMKNEALHCLDVSSPQVRKWTPSDIKWVVTIPSVWSLWAKEIMKKAAHAAGIVDPIMITESEAAAIYCRKTLPDMNDGNEAKLLTFLVADLGGGTADFTVHRCVDPKQTKHTNVIEVVAPSGGPWGGHTINEQFLKLLIKLFGDARMNEFQYGFPGAFLELEHAFEGTKTRATKPNSTTSNMCSVKLPFEFIQLIPKLKANQNLGTNTEVELSWFVHEQQDRESEQIIAVFQEDYYTGAGVQQQQPIESKEPQESVPDRKVDPLLGNKVDPLVPFDELDDTDFEMNDLADEEKDTMTKFLAEYKTNIWFQNGKLSFPLSTMMRFFEEPLKQIESHILAIVKQHPEITTTFLVGGFSQSGIVRNYLEEHVFTPELGVKLCAGPEPQQAVLFGAVMYGNRPRQIQSRIAKHTFGITTILNVTKKNRDQYREEFKDVPRRLKLYKGKPVKWIENIFLPLCVAGDVLPVASPEDLKPLMTRKDERIWKMVHITPNYDEQTSVTLNVYESIVSHKRCWMSPASIHNKEFQLIGCVRIQLVALPSEALTKPRILQVWFYFGDQEILTSVVDTLTGKVADSKFVLQGL